MQKAVIISAPSGAGKTSVVRCLLEKEAGLEFSISATSRQKRSGETDGKDYFFITAGEFRKKIDAGEFLEWEQVYPGIYYGTLRSEIERIWNNRKTAVFDVDVKGGVNLKSHLGRHALSIFIKVRDFETLGQRLRDRKTESEGSLKTRLEKAAYEMTFENRFDAVVINDNLESACDEVYNKVRNFLIT